MSQQSQLVAHRYTSDGRRVIDRYDRAWTCYETPFQIITAHEPWPVHRIEPDVLNGARFLQIRDALAALERFLNSSPT